MFPVLNDDEKVEDKLKLKSKKKCLVISEPMTKTKKFDTNAFTCIICDRTFSHKGAMTMHKRFHHI